MGSQILTFDFYSTLNRLHVYCVGGVVLLCFWFFNFIFLSVIVWKYSICKEDQVFPYALFSYFRFLIERICLKVLGLFDPRKKKIVMLGECGVFVADNRGRAGHTKPEACSNYS